MTITTTRTDCVRDNRQVSLPLASTIGFGRTVAKRGNWVRFQQNDLYFVGRVIGRVTCERKMFVEVACASNDFSSVYVRWVEPAAIVECRKNPPKAVFDFLAGEWADPEQIHQALAHGVSDLKDQLAE